MKQIKKITALLLALVMAMALGITSSALTADGSITVTGMEANDRVDYYQILKWNNGWELTDSYSSLEDQKADIIAGNITADLAESIAEIAATALGNGIADESGNWTGTVEPGLYLIKVTPQDSGYVYNPAFVANDYTIGGNTVAMSLEKSYSDSAAPKKAEISVDKKVNGQDSTDGYSVGDELPFTITSTIPTYPANARYATFKITDTPTGMEIKEESVQVKVGDADASEYAEVSDNVLTVDLPRDFILENGGKTVDVTYTATLTSVNPSSGKASNKAKVEYNTNPFVDTTKEVEDEFEVKTYGLVFEKTDESEKPLEGAVFDLYDNEGNQITSADGTFKTFTTEKNDGHTYVFWSGLKAGTYTIKETEAPDGYVKVNDFTIEVGSNSTGDNPATKDLESNYTVKTEKVQNISGSSLPSTGGIGTTIFYILGVILVLGAGSCLVIRRKHSEN